MLRALLAAVLLLSESRARAFEEPAAAERHLADMIRVLETGAWAERIRAVHELEYMHDAAIPGLALAMEDGDWQVRLTAVQALSPRSVEGLAAMRRLLKHEPCPVVRLMTLHALGSHGPDGEEQLKAMRWLSYASPQEVNACRDQAGPGRASWARRRGGAPSAAAAAPPSARPAELPGREPAYRASAPEPEEIAQSHDVVVTPDPVPRAAPAAVRRAPEELPEPTKFQRRIELDAILDEPPSAPERGKAPSSNAIARASGTPESLGRPFALPGRGGDYAPDAQTAADELGRRGAAAEAAVPALMRALRDKSPRVRSSAGLALGNIGVASEDVVALLIKALKDRSGDVRYAAALGLSRIDTPEANKAFRAHVSAEARATIDKSKVKSR